MAALERCMELNVPRAFCWARHLVLNVHTFAHAASTSSHIRAHIRGALLTNCLLGKTEPTGVAASQRDGAGVNGDGGGGNSRQPVVWRLRPRTAGVALPSFAPIRVRIVRIRVPLMPVVWCA